MLSPSLSWHLAYDDCNQKHYWKGLPLWRDIPLSILGLPSVCSSGHVLALTLGVNKFLLCNSFNYLFLFYLELWNMEISKSYCCINQANVSSAVMPSLR